MLAGLAKPGICKMPLAFCASAVLAASEAANSPPAAKQARSRRIIGVALPRRAPELRSAAAGPLLLLMITGKNRGCCLWSRKPSLFGDHSASITNPRLFLRAGRKFNTARKIARPIDHKAMQIK